jgi:SAM-dependent methyltransferase
MASVALTPKARPEAHDAARSLISAQFPSARGLVAIDAAAGNGYMSQWLIDQGFAVRPFDLAPAGFAAQGAVCAVADLNREIPAPDAVADVAVSIETIEHLENPFQLVRELTRVTKPGGLVVITTPNVHFIRARLKALLSGTSTYFEFVAKDPWGQHITPFSLGQLLYAFDRDGLVPVHVSSVGPRKRWATEGVFETLNGLTWLGALALKKKRACYPDHYLNRLTPAELWALGRGEILVVAARRPLA